MAARSLINLALFALYFWQEVQGEAVHLTIENFEELVDGKNVFIKFYAPWCGHCRAMAEDFDKLAEDYKDSKIAIVGQVDCTSDEGQPVCEDFDVQGFPTLVYGDPMSAETYDGARDYESLSAFAEAHISKPICSLYNIDNCDANQKEMIAKLEAMTDDDLKGIVTNVEDRVKSEETNFDKKVAAIQKQYDDLVETFNKNLDVIKEEFNYRFVEQIMNIRLEEEDSVGEEL